MRLSRFQKKPFFYPCLFIKTNKCQPCNKIDYFQPCSYAGIWDNTTLDLESLTDNTAAAAFIKYQKKKKYQTNSIILNQQIYALHTIDGMLPIISNYINQLN